MRTSTIRRMMLAFACVLAAAPVSALAQDSATVAYASASPPANPADEPTPPADGALSPDESSALGSALMFDPGTLVGGKPAKPLRLPNLSNAKDLDVSRTDKPDGSSTVVVKQPLPTDWNAKVGADLGFASAPPNGNQTVKALPATRDDRGAGAAWASADLSSLATVDARAEQSSDRGKVGTTLKKSIPLGGQFSVTVQDSVSVTDTFGASAATAPSDVPLMTAPPPPAAVMQQSPKVWCNEKTAKFDILPTGTTLGASFVSTSTDPVTHNMFSAEQKLYGPLHVTTAVTDVGQPTSSKKITAGFKLNW
jgi:hypothetical protein